MVTDTIDSESAIIMSGHIHGRVYHVNKEIQLNYICGKVFYFTIAASYTLNSVDAIILFH